jgi:hypothetical protein
VDAARALPSAVYGAGFELVFVDADGVRSREPLLSCWNTPFERSGQIRRFTAHRGQRSFSGLWYFTSSDEHVGYESWLERDRLVLLDAEPEIVAVASQPYLHKRTGGMIGSLSHLIRAAALTAIDTGTEAITRDLLDDTPVDYAAESDGQGVA